MKVREAKKLLKAEIDEVHPTRKRYTMVVWKKKDKVFLCQTLHGQRIKIFYN